LAAFHLAFAYPHLCWLIAAYLYGLVQLAHQSTGRRAFYWGLTMGLGVFVPHLGFLWTIFGPAAAALWTVLAFWHSLFLLLARLGLKHFGRVTGTLLMPILWTGLEYFRSELYYLRFSWLSVGYAFAGAPCLGWLACLGVYGIGFVLMSLVTAFSFLPWRVRIAGLGLLAGLSFCAPPAPEPVRAPPVVAGIQWEFPHESTIVSGLDKLVRDHPLVQLVVLSEYTFWGPIPPAVMRWCQAHRRYLIVGGQDLVSEKQFYNTAFVIGPEGKVVFQQAKGVPIQFMKDGLPAREQRPWDSPWGKAGLCICYDLSYRRVVDPLVRQGSQMLFVPTMDVTEWGAHEHWLHSRVALVRAAEYRLPVFRVASSGCSQYVNRAGRELVAAPFPGQGLVILGPAPGDFGPPGRLPLDTWLAPGAAALTLLLGLWLSALAIRKHRSSKTTLL
jgi:apolipoprotein N-acyltransferase